MPRKKTVRPQSLKTMLARAPEIGEVSRQLASLALAKVEQDGPLGVRQREQLRRALATAGEALSWTGPTEDDGDSMVEVTNDFMTIAKGGARSIARDLAAELAGKRTEIAELSDASTSAGKLAEDPDSTYPTDIIYSYTVRDAFGDLVTKTETLTVNDAQEAQNAAAALERSLTGRGKLTDLMILDLERKQGRLDVTTRTLSDFLESSQQLLREVLANLQ